MKETSRTEFRAFVFPYLANELNAAQRPSIGRFIDFLQSGDTNEYHFAGCLAIDIYSGLIEAEQWSKLVEDFMMWSDDISIQKLDMFIESKPDHNLVSKKCMYGQKEEYVRVIPKQSFKKHYAATGLKYDSNDVPFEFNKSRIQTEGWSGRKDLVWLTTYRDFEKIYNASDRKDLPNRLCDFLGLPRDENSLKQGSPEDGGKVVYFYIRYPKSFPETCYQPNTTNATWISDNPLFLSYPFSDGYGRTFNFHNNHETAKEIVHKKSNYWHDDFMVDYIGIPTPAIFERDCILEEILNRFPPAYERKK